MILPRNKKKITIYSGPQSTSGRPVLGDVYQFSPDSTVCPFTTGIHGLYFQGTDAKPRRTPACTYPKSDMIFARFCKFFSVLYTNTCTVLFIFIQPS